MIRRGGPTHQPLRLITILWDDDAGALPPEPT